jgi:hypothetical protein
MRRLNLISAVAIVIAGLITPHLTAARQDDSIPVNAYLVAIDDGGQRGPLFGCNDSIVAVEARIRSAPTVEGRIAAALEALFALDIATDPETGLYNALAPSSLAVDAVTVTDGVALVELSGTLLRGGTCEDPRIEQQIVATAGQFPEIRGVAVLFNGGWLLPSARGATCFEVTGFCTENAFQRFWESGGGLPVFGYPISDLLVEDGRIVQYFERQRFEYHPENHEPYDVLLGLLGREAAEHRGLLDHPAFLPVNAATDGHCRFFPETGHRLCHGFAAYWTSHGLDLGDEGLSFRESLLLFGYPISEEFTDPQTGLTIQYFERAVFEWHPGNRAPWDILLERLGVWRQALPNPLAGGIVVTFDVEGERFNVWLTNPTTIAQVEAFIDAGVETMIPNGPLLRGPGTGDHNQPWNWHLDPAQTEVAEVTIELCDAMPSYVEANLDAFIEEVGRYCPWNATVVAVRDYR